MKRTLALLLIPLILLPSTSRNGWSEESEPARWEARSNRAERWFFEDLPHHLGNDLKETFWNRWHLLALAGGVGFTAGIHEADPEIQQAFQPERPMGKTFDGILGVGFHPLVLGGAGLITLGVAKLVDARKTAVTAGTMLEALFLTEALTVGLQFATQRGRPDGSNSRSFPSGHTSGAFTLAAVTEVLYGPWFGIPSFALASLVGVSRIDSNKHVASDVVAGALLGTLIGIGTAKFHKKEFSDYFIVPTAGDGSMSLSLVHVFR